MMNTIQREEKGLGFAPGKGVQGKVLTIDDDPVVREVTATSLELAGYEVWAAETGEQALGYLEERGLPHLAIVDIMLPGINGPELCQKIQEFSDLPVIMLTSVDDHRTKVDTLLKVAEDYIVKPFEPAELVARVNRLMQRLGGFSYPLGAQVQVDQRLGVDFAHQLAFINESPVELTPTETKLLYILMRNAGSTLLTNFLLRRMWPLEEIFEDALRTHVYRLRQKIEESPRKPRYVLTRRGVGYSFPVMSR